MKRSLLFVAVLMSGVAFADTPAIPNIVNRTGPSTSSSSVTISAAGIGLRNCLTDLTVISNSTYTVRILDGNTTSYSLLLGGNQGVVEEWPIQNPWCGSPNTQLKMTVDNGTYSINYSGLVIRQ